MYVGSGGGGGGMITYSVLVLRPTEIVFKKVVKVSPVNFVSMTRTAYHTRAPAYLATGLDAVRQRVIKKSVAI